MSLKKVIQQHRPEGYSGKGDQYLTSITEGVVRLLSIENERIDDLLWLSDEDITECRKRILISFTKAFEALQHMGAGYGLEMVEENHDYGCE